MDISIVELNSVPAHENSNELNEPAHASVAYAALPDGRAFIVTGGADGKVSLRDARAPDSILATHSEPNPIEAIAVDIESSVIAIATDTKTKLLDLATLTVKGVVGSEALPPRALAFSPKGFKLASGGDFSGITVTTVSPSSLLPPPLTTSIDPPLTGRVIRS